MAIATKKVTDYRKIGGDLVEVHPKTEASQVSYGSSTVHAVLSGLATVASTGSYNDLTDKPTIPSMSGSYLVTDSTNKVTEEEFLFQSSNDSYLRIGGGSTRLTGANIKLYGASNAEHPGRVDIQAIDSEGHYTTLKFDPDDSKPIFYGPSGSHTVAYEDDIPTLPGAATTASSGFMTPDMVSKLSSIASSANNYVLPNATTASKGGVIIGSGLDVSGATISVAGSYTTSDTVSSIASAIVSSGGYLTGITSAAVVSALGYTPPQSDTNTTYTGTSGVTLTNTTFSHATGAGWNHVPSGGAANNVLVYDSAGTAKWAASVNSATSAGNATTVDGIAGSSALSWGTEVTLYTVGGNAVKAKLPANPNTNTTYTFATGDANGQIKVTPSGGTAQNVSVKGLGTAAYTSTGAFASATHTHSYLPLSGGTVTGNVTVSGLFTVPNYRGTDSIFCRTTTSNTVSGGTERVIRMNTQTNGNMGIYDISYAKWIVRANASGTLYFNEHQINADVPSDAKFTDTVYTHPTTAGNKHIPSAGTAADDFLTWSADGTAKWSNRLAAAKLLTNESVGSSATHFVTLTTNWAKFGYTGVADARIALGITSGTTAAASGTAGVIYFQYS